MNTTATETATKATTDTNGSGNCLCGCGQLVITMGKALYRPGHDARHAGNVARLVAETGDDSAIAAHLPTEALQRKAENMVLRLRTKAQEKSDRDAAKATAKALRSTKGTTEPAWVDADPIKVGRWSYPARQFGTTIQRNERRDGSGSWIAV